MKDSERAAGREAMNQGKGVKYDGDKVDYTLLPWDALEPITRVLMAGAAKYTPDNWRKVPNAVDRYHAALLRHVAAWARGEAADPETGLPHMAHAACCIMFIVALESAPGAAPDMAAGLRDLAAAENTRDPLPPHTVRVWVATCEDCQGLGVGPCGIVDCAGCKGKGFRVAERK